MKRRPHWPSFDGPLRSSSPSSTHHAASSTESQGDAKPSLEDCMRYISGYSEELRDHVISLIKADRLGEMLKSKYPAPHEHNSNKLLRAYTQQIKTQYLKTTERLSKICFDDQLHLVHHALGTQTFVSSPMAVG